MNGVLLYTALSDGTLMVPPGWEELRNLECYEIDLAQYKPLEGFGAVDNEENDTTEIYREVLDENGKRKGWEFINPEAPSPEYLKGMRIIQGKPIGEDK